MKYSIWIKKKSGEILNMRLDKNTILLYAVTDSRWTLNRTLGEQVEDAIIGGATCIQLREKELNEEDFIKKAFEIKKICDKYNIPLFINDNVKVAVACKAEGIHIGQSDMNVEEVRKLVGDNMIIGVSATNLEEAVLAEEQGADYLGVGAMFTTNVKDDATPVSIDELTKICNRVSIPVCAIGGISLINIEELKNSGVDGFAIVSAIFSKDDIKKATKELLQKAKGIVE